MSGEPRRRQRPAFTRNNLLGLMVLLAVVCAACIAGLVQAANAQTAWGIHADLTGGNGFNGALWLAFFAALAGVLASLIALVAAIVVYLINIKRSSDLAEPAVDIGSTEYPTE